MPGVISQFWEFQWPPLLFILLATVSVISVFVNGHCLLTVVGFLSLFLFICAHLIQVRAYCPLDTEHVIISVHNTKQYKCSSGPKLTEIYSYHNTVLAYRACEYT